MAQKKAEKRRRARMRKQQLAMEQELAEQNGAACKIQARVRGRGDKRRVAQMREEQTHAAGRIQSIHRGVTTPSILPLLVPFCLRLVRQAFSDGWIVVAARKGSTERWSTSLKRMRSAGSLRRTQCLLVSDLRPRLGALFAAFWPHFGI